MKNNFYVTSNIKMEGVKIWKKLPRENLTNWLCLSRFSKSPNLILCLVAPNLDCDCAAHCVPVYYGLTKDKNLLEWVVDERSGGARRESSSSRCTLSFARVASFVLLVLMMTLVSLRKDERFVSWDVRSLPRVTQPWESLPRLSKKSTLILPHCKHSQGLSFQLQDILSLNH